ncbi:MAG TPA: hypothetical protein DCL31_17170 [Clostridium sp.]|nr:hypothetical protein [Clostridium sp.]
MGNTSYKRLRKNDPINSRLIEQAYGSDIDYYKIEHGYPIINNLIPAVKNWVQVGKTNNEERKGFRL